MCRVAQEGSEKENDMEKEEEVTAEKDVPIGIETHLISSKLSEEENSELILLLKEFKDVFT